MDWWPSSAAFSEASQDNLDAIEDDEEQVQQPQHGAQPLSDPRRALFAKPPGLSSQTELDLTQHIDALVDAQLHMDEGGDGAHRAIFAQDENGQSVQLRVIADLPAAYRSVFEGYVSFNLVQTRVFDDVVHSDKSVVVTAPTGSGKTAIFELAVVRELMRRDGHLGEDDKRGVAPKMLYMAPTKSLCSERFRDWDAKLTPIGIRCLELTGDTGYDYNEVDAFNLIVTTPEKWDAVTRRSEDLSVLRNFVLVMVDEVHVINDRMRGHTLEAVLTRMKMNAGRLSPTSGHSLRFLAVSATIPNVEDVAMWLSSNASSYKFGEQTRPVKLRRVVLGYPLMDERSKFKFEMNLTYKLANIIFTYSESKPTLIFASSRRSACFTAKTLGRDAKFEFPFNHSQVLGTAASSVNDKQLAACVAVGVGFHHAGMDVQDRRMVEELFLNGYLPVVVSTSTLAVGVNLPAHLVVIKGTFHMDKGAYQEYSEADILQMVGRAGRPQFDCSATAVILTSLDQKGRYEALVNGRQMIESSLHEHLVEHLNSEIVLRTIMNSQQALNWLRSTYLFVRAVKQPSKYNLDPNLDSEGVANALEHLCVQGIADLAKLELIENRLDQDQILPLEAGKLMARFCLNFETLKNFSDLKGDEELSSLLKVLCRSEEFAEVQLRRNEKGVLNQLNQDKKRATVRFPLAGKVKDNAMKVNVLIQSHLGCLHISDASLERESQRLLQIGQRLVRCLRDFLWAKSNNDKFATSCYKSLRNGIILHKCFTCGLWNNSDYVSKQLPRIGKKYSNILVNAGLTSFEKIASANPRDLELIVNKLQPFGNTLRAAAANMPKYNLGVEQIGTKNQTLATIKVVVELENAERIAQNSTTGKRHRCALLVGVNNALLLKVWVSDMTLLYRKYERKILISRIQDHGQVTEVKISWISESISGLDKTTNFVPEFENTNILGVKNKGNIQRNSDFQRRSDHLVENELLSSSLEAALDASWPELESPSPAKRMKEDNDCGSSSTRKSQTKTKKGSLKNLAKNTKAPSISSISKKNDKEILSQGSKTKFGSAHITSGGSVSSNEKNAFLAGSPLTKEDAITSVNNSFVPLSQRLKNVYGESKVGSNGFVTQSPSASHVSIDCFSPKSMNSIVFGGKKEIVDEEMNCTSLLSKALTTFKDDEKENSDSFLVANKPTPTFKIPHSKIFTPRRKSYQSMLAYFDSLLEKTSR